MDPKNLERIERKKERKKKKESGSRPRARKWGLRNIQHTYCFWGRPASDIDDTLSHDIRNSEILASAFWRGFNILSERDKQQGLMNRALIFEWIIFEFPTFAVLLSLVLLRLVVLGQCT